MTKVVYVARISKKSLDALLALGYTVIIKGGGNA